MLITPGDLIPVLPAATAIPWTRRKSQVNGQVLPSVQQVVTPCYIVSHCIKRVTTSVTYSIVSFVLSLLFVPLSRFLLLSVPKVSANLYCILSEHEICG